ncbi:MAG: hypothetical protein ABI347_01690 [Nitrososphaera sp.]|jgi:hypothetical protein
MASAEHEDELPDSDRNEWHPESDLVKLSTRFWMGLFDLALVNIALGVVFWSLPMRMWMDTAWQRNDCRQR